jgi:1-acyl-sn-glycerol-3-phosphate acyltransferase
VFSAAATIAFWVFVAVTSVLIFPFALLTWAVTAPFDPRRRAVHMLTCFWASLYTWLNPWWRVSIEGREHIDTKRTYVIVANHQSLIDILVIFRLFVPFTWVSKVENFAVPIIGWNMRLNNYISLKRGDKDSGRAMLQECVTELEGGTSVMMFPEGTRTRTGRLQPFKPGAFELARRADVPLLPVVIEGSYSALPARGWVLRGRHRIRMRVLPALTLADLGASVGEAAAAMNQRYAAALATTS